MSVPVNASIVEHFQTLEDPRIERTKQHPLLDILVIALCTLLTGGEGFQDRELFGKSKHGAKPSSPCRMGFPLTTPLAASLPASIPSASRSALCPGPRRSHSSRKGRLSHLMGKP